MSRPDWMHALVADVASEVVGIDIDPTLVARATRRGYNIVQGDAQTMDLDRTFDVVFAGEIVEHLSCPGSFLNAVRRHLEPRGLLVLTTPNVFALSNFVYRLGGRARVNAEHTCWYDETTISQLLCRHGYNNIKISYVGHRTPGRFRAISASALRALLPEHLGKNTLLAVSSPNPGTPVEGDDGG
jgi:SAM-dependent methyltransferase